MKIAVLGSGAIGSLIGGLLAQSGETVTLISSNQLHLTTVESQGLWIDTPSQHLHVTPKVGSVMTERPDVCILAVQTQDIATKLTENKSYLENVPIVTIENNPRAASLAASVLGNQYILSAVLLLSATLQPGRVITTSTNGSMLIGEPFDSTGFAESLVTMFSHIMPVYYVDNIHGAQWTRLITTLYNGLSAATGLNLQQIIDHAGLRSLSVSIMKEATDVTKVAGIQLQSLPELPPVNKIVSLLHMPPPVSEMIPRLLGKVHGNATGATILTELKQGQQAVVDFINGEIIKLGEDVGAIAPYNDAIVQLAHRVYETRQYFSPEQVIDYTDRLLQTQAQPEEGSAAPAID